MTDNNKTRWETLEEWLFDHETDRFTSRSLASSARISKREASQMISAYLGAQRARNSTTLYVLKREGRTSRAVWSVGQRTADAKIIGGVLFEDISVKVMGAFAPDLRRLAARNPRAARYCEKKIEAVLEGVLVVLASAVDQISEEDPAE